MPDIRLRQQLIGTDLGELWLADRGGERCLIRLLDRRLADKGFRSALENLSGDITRHPLPRVLPIVEHDYYGDHYYIEYRLDWPRTKSIPEYFAQAHWLKRLSFARDITRAYDDWRKCVSPPLGLHGGRVVACHLNGQWVAHLAPCPRIPLASPYDLITADPYVLAAVAPERLRGVAVSGVREDVYAAGILVLQALGIRTFAANTGKEARIEAQARASLAVRDFEHSDVERVLWQISIAKESLTELCHLIRRCAAFSPDGRPPGVQEQEFQSALSRVLAFEDAASIAKALDDRARPAEALQFLEWALARQATAPGEEHRLRLLAADFCNRLLMPARELYHLDRLLQIVPGNYDLERRRMERRCDAYLKRISDRQKGTDAEADWLLAELKRLRPPDPGQLEKEDRLRVKEDHLRAAMIHGRRGDLYQRSRELWAITELEWADIEALFLYGLSLRDLEAQAGIGEQHRGNLFATMNRLLNEADRRLKGLKQAGILDDEEVKTWAERFQSLQLY